MLAVVQGDRTDSVSRVILATPRTLFRTFMDAEMLASWRTPDEMTSRISHFEPSVGGGYSMLLRHGQDAPPTAGRTRTREDEIEVRFITLLPDELVVEEVHFLSLDPAFAEPMMLTTRLEPTRDGTKVTLTVSNVPSVMPADDHHDRLAAALRSLARLTE